MVTNIASLLYAVWQPALPPVMDRVSQQLSSDWWEKVWLGNLNEETSLIFPLRLQLEGTGNSELTILAKSFKV